MASWAFLCRVNSDSFLTLSKAAVTSSCAAPRSHRTVTFHTLSLQLRGLFPTPFVCTDPSPAEDFISWPGAEPAELLSRCYPALTRVAGPTFATPVLSAPGEGPSVRERRRHKARVTPVWLETRVAGDFSLVPPTQAPF